jgi:hypothetical protein
MLTLNLYRQEVARREKLAEYKRRYLSSEKGQATTRAYSKRYQETHREELLAKARAYSLRKCDLKREARQRLKLEDPVAYERMLERWRVGNRRRNTPERVWRYSLVKYGITPSEYESLCRAQGGVCAICRNTCVTGRRLAVDHCHATGAVRGLLCGKCNQAVGLLGDNPSTARDAAKYLEEWQCRRTT